LKGTAKKRKEQQKDVTRRDLALCQTGQEDSKAGKYLKSNKWTAYACPLTAYKQNNRKIRIPFTTLRLT